MPSEITLLAEADPHFAKRKTFKPVGFYKRGCQVKTLLLSREEGIFFGHPAQLAAPRTLSGARLASPNASDICGIMFLCVLSRGLIAPLSSVMAIANHGSI
jgi:hypothetical protein